MKTYIALIALVILLLPRPAAAQGNLVFNGGFDIDTSGWSLTNVSSGWGYSPKGGDPDGFINLVGDPLVSPTASQTITGLTIGADYVISGEYYERSVDSTENSFGVAIDGNYLFETAGQGDIHWHNFSLSYTATSSRVDLSFSSQLNETGISYGIDNIAMYAVPEPSTLSLFIICILFLCRRMKRPNTALELTCAAPCVCRSVEIREFILRSFRCCRARSSALDR